MQLRLVFLFFMEDKNRNMPFKALGPQTEIILNNFSAREVIWAFSYCMQVWKLARQNLPLFPDHLSIRKGHLWSPKQTFQWDKNGLFPSAKETVWGTNLGSGYRQDSHQLKDVHTQAIDLEEKKKKIVKIHIGLSQNTVSLASMNDGVDFC